MKPPLSDELRVRHVLDAIKEIESYLQNVSLDEFLANSEKRFATIKQIEIIGEACARISSTVKDNYPDIEWKNIVGFRNISIHEYFCVNFQIVWQNLRVVKLLSAFKWNFERASPKYVSG